MSTNVNKKNKEVRLCRLLLWYPSLGEYRLGRMLYTVERARSSVVSLFSQRGIISVIYPL